jgi:Ca-activated chloride channel homolog
MKITSVFTALLVFCVVTLAQDETIRVETNLVTLNVAVSDRQGKAVTGLAIGDFKLFDNGVEQAVDTFSARDSAVSYGIVYDLHPTADEQTASVLTALKKFTSGLGPRDDFFVTVFNERGSLTTEFVPTREQIDRQIESGPNSLYDAIFAASARSSRARNAKRILIVLTDGTDHKSHHSLKELKARLRSVNLPVYSVTFGGRDRTQYGYSDIFREGRFGRFGTAEIRDLDTAVVTELSKTTGGQTFEANVRNRLYLEALLAKVGTELGDQYVLGFSPDQSDGKWHKLKVVVTDQKAKKLKVSNRPGYLSPRGQEK